MADSVEAEGVFYGADSGGWVFGVTSVTGNTGCQT